MRINSISYTTNQNKPYKTTNLYINKTKQDTYTFSGRWDKDTRPLSERFLNVIGICKPTSKLHQAETAKETKSILDKIKRDKELRETLTFDDINFNLPIHLAKNKEQTEVLLDASPDEETVEKQLLAKNENGDIPLHLARNSEQSEILLDFSPNEKILKKQLLQKNRTKHIPLHFATSANQLKTLLEASPDEKTLIKQLTSQAEDGRLPIHFTYFDKEKETILNASPNDEIKFIQLDTRNKRGKLPCRDFDDTCVKTAIDLIEKSETLSNEQKKKLILDYKNLANDKALQERYKKAYNTLIKNKENRS